MQKHVSFFALLIVGVLTTGIASAACDFEDVKKAVEAEMQKEDSTRALTRHYFKFVDVSRGSTISEANNRVALISLFESNIKGLKGFRFFDLTNYRLDDNCQIIDKESGGVDLLKIVQEADAAANKAKITE